jgi:hypothetical protein
VPKVAYAKPVSDNHIKSVLQRMADFFGKDISVHSGDRDFVPKGGSKTSLHLHHRAADFHVSGISDAKAYEFLKKNTGKVFDCSQGYELILHGVHTATGGPHLHIGHYDGAYKGIVRFKTEGLVSKTRNVYDTEAVEIDGGSTNVVTTQPSTPKPSKDTRPGTTAGEVRLSGSVGAGGKNVHDDVMLVQALLNRARKGTHQGRVIGTYYEALAEDGKCGDKTLHAIKLFQKHVAGMPIPDSRVDPDGRTLRLLSAWRDDKPGTSSTPGSEPKPGQPNRTNPAVVTQFVKNGRGFPSRDGYPVFAQGRNDKGEMEDWGELPLGTKTVSKIGCAMTSVTMALCGITAQTFTPDEMLSFMKANKGFGPGGDILDWNLMGKLVKPPVTVKRVFGFKADKIDQELDAGRPVLVHVDYYDRAADGSVIKEHDGEGDHWFLITSRTADKHYQAHDPAGGRMITLHRMGDGRLEADIATKFGTKYRTVGNAVTFSRGPGVFTAENKTPLPVKNVVTTPVVSTTQPPKVITTTPKTNTTTTPKTNTVKTGMAQVKLLKPAPAVEKAIRDASTTVGVDYGYMMAMAAQESAFDPAIEAKTSSATGLYQFLKQTWLGVVKEHGEKHGLGKQAKEIEFSASKKKYVASFFWEDDILDLRKDAKYSALMGAEFARDNQKYLTKKLGREVSPTDLYMAHFLGPSDAAKFLGARDSGKGLQSAAAMFPAAASANESIFYSTDKKTKTKTVRTLEQVYKLMENKIAPKAEAYSRARVS